MKKIILILLLLVSLNVKAQVVPLSGSFSIGAPAPMGGLSTFNCVSRSPSYDPSSVDKILVISDANAPVFSDATLVSSTCNSLQRASETNKYHFKRYRNNSIQMFNIIKSVFSPQRCQQLLGYDLDISVFIYPNNNTIYTADFCTSSLAGITQQEIVQLNTFIKMNTSFTFPNIQGNCTTVAYMGIGTIHVDFSTLYSDPYYNGIDSMWDAYEDDDDE